MMSVMSLAKTGSIAGNDFLYHEVQERMDPLDVETFNSGTTPVWACATDVTFGTPAYLPIHRMPDDMDVAQDYISDIIGCQRKGAFAMDMEEQEMTEKEIQRFIELQADEGKTPSEALEALLKMVGGEMPEFKNRD